MSIGLATRHGGRVAKRWRMKRASDADWSEATYRSKVFPLELSSSDQTRLRELYPGLETLQRVMFHAGEGSLFQFVATVLLNGFALFSSSTQARIEACTADVSTCDAWRNGMRATGVDSEALLPHRIVGRVLCTPRGRSGAALAWDVQSVAEVLCGYTTGTSILRVGEGEAHAHREFAAIMVRAGSSWQNASDDPVAFFAACDEILKQQGWDVPSLQTECSRLLNIQLPEGSTITWVGSSCPPVRHPTPEALFAALAGRFGHSDISSIERAICSDRASGLSWLLGTGLKYWATASTDELLGRYGLGPVARPYLEVIQSSARSVPPLDPCATTMTSYGQIRTAFASKVGCWLATYHAALEITREQCPDVDTVKGALEGVSGPVADQVARQLGLKDAAEYAHLGARYCEVASDAAAYGHAVLSGTMRGDVSHARMSVDRFVEQHVQLQSVLHRARARFALLAKKHAEPTVQKSANDHAAALDDVLALLDRAEPAALPRWTEESTDWQPEQLVQRHNALATELREITDQVLSYARMHGGEHACASRTAVRQERHVQSVRGRTPQGFDGRVPAAAEEFDRMARMVRSLAGPARALALSMLSQFVVDRAELQAFVEHSKGTYFRSEFEAGKQRVLRLQRDRLTDVDGREMLLVLRDESIKHLAACTVNPKQSRNTLQDLFVIERALDAILYSHLPDIRFPASLLVAGGAEAKRSPPAQGEATLCVQQVQERLSLLQQHIASLRRRLLRGSHRKSISFAVDRDDTVFYVEKVDKAWCVPAQYAKSAGSLGAICRELGVVPRSPEARRSLLKRWYSSARDDVGFRTFLRQVPHDWYYPTPLVGVGVAVQNAFSLRKGILRKPHSPIGLRLIGPSEQKAMLDESLGMVGPSLGAMSFKVDREQCFRLGYDATSGSLSMETRDSVYSMQIAVPLLTKADGPRDSVPATSSWMHRMIAIDLNKHVLAWALFELPSAFGGSVNDPDQCVTPIEHGVVQTPSVAAFVDRQQRRPNYLAAGVALSRARFDAVVGQVCREIDRLCAEKLAFPVIERPSLHPADRILGRIFRAVHDRYNYSNVAVREARRRLYWHGAVRWTHPALQRSPGDAPGESPTRDRGGLLRLFPGSTVLGHGNSKTCSCCRRNALDALQQVAVGDSSRIPVVGGMIETPVGRISLHVGRPSHSDAGVYWTAAEVRRAILRKLRSSRGIRSRSTGSWFICPFADCNFRGDADVNAATNAGRKWLSQMELVA